MSGSSSDGSTEAWARLLAVHAAVVDEIEARLKSARLPPLAWYDVLWTLEQAPGGRLRMAELAERLVVSRYNVTRLVDRLQEDGLVGREAAADDARGAFAVLTAKGRALRRRMWPVYGRAIDELFMRALSVRDREAVANALGRVQAALRERPR